MYLSRRPIFAKRFFSASSPEPEIKYSLKEFLQEYEARANRYQDKMQEEIKLEIKVNVFLYKPE
jgi:hypothetical protein